VILLEPIVEIAVGPVQHVTAERLADRTGVGIMSIGRHPNVRYPSVVFLRCSLVAADVQCGQFMGHSS
jgi:hypothetical protein